MPALLLVLVAAPLHVVVANVGNLDEAKGGPCPSEPYHGATCSIAQEQAVRANLDRLQPDVIVLLEVLNASACLRAPRTRNPDHVCTHYEARRPYQQVERYVGPGYTSLCNGFTCVATRLAVKGCPGGATCMQALERAPVPEACRPDNTGVWRAQLQHGGEPLTLVVAHALPAVAPAGDACRAAQLLQAFDDLPAPGRTLVAGDFNTDPYRFPWRVMSSAAVWRDWVGEGRRFEALSDGEPSWVGLGRYDYLLTDHGFGACELIDLDAPLDTFDHRALDCWLAQ
jgi:endonuclease/exonuclease/phosphatase family metal-dependent hydrolase